jgi:transposase InsO family protein
MGIRDRPTSPRSPWQNGYAERLIGSIQRECLDHVAVFGERHLRHVLLSYKNYYNETRIMRRARTYRWTRMRPYRARSREQGVFFVFQSWAGCITNMFGFDARQAQVTRINICNSK